MVATATDRLYGESSGVAVKAPVRAVSTVNIAALSGLLVVGGYQTTPGDRVLLTAQTSSIDNGIYNASVSNWTRSGDWDGAYDVVNGTLVVLPLANGSGAFYQANGPVASYVLTPGTDPITFSLLNNPAITYPQTGAEIAAGVTPANTSFWPLPIADVRRYGWLTSNTAAQNATALAAAIASLPLAGALPGGTVQLPPGTYALNPVVIPASVAVRGASKRGTIITHTNAAGEILFTLGGTAGTLYYGCGLSDLTVQLTGTAGTCVLLQGTAGAEVSRLYLEGETISSGRTTFGLVIDGSNASAFFNHVTDVECNHLHTGFQQKTSGTTQPTQNYFTNCNGTGDVGTDATSIGVAHGDGINSGIGQLSVYESCDFESYGQGVHCYSATGPATWIGCRFEGNTVDVMYDINASGQTFVGGNPGITTGLVTDNTGDNRNRYIGCWAGSNANVTSLFGLGRFGANVAADVPMRADLAPAHTGNIWEVRNSSGVVIGGISPSASNIAPGLRPFNVAGVSGTGVPANNMRGTAAFAAATSVAVAFAVAEPDASYLIALGGNAAGFCWVTAKGTGGFTINCSVSNSNSTDWHLLR